MNTLEYYENIFNKEINEQLIILPKNENFTSYDGFIELKNKQYYITFNIQNTHEIDINSLQFDDESMNNLLKNHNNLINIRLKYYINDINQFISEFCNLLDEIIINNNNNKILINKPESNYYFYIINEIEQIGWDYISSINDDMTEIILKINDINNRIHYLKLNLPNDYPRSLPKYEYDLPIEWEIKPFTISNDISLNLNNNNNNNNINNNINNNYEIFSNNNNNNNDNNLLYSLSASISLNEIINQFQNIINEYQEFWNILDDLDNNTWILEPENPKRSDLFRRIAISPQISIIISIDPKTPNILNDLKFLGIENQIQTLRTNFNNNISYWDNNKTIRKNLINLLDIEFPTKKEAILNDSEYFCGICYTYRINVNNNNNNNTKIELPDQICENENCRKAYHHHCLQAYFAPSGKISFDTIFGECPYCYEMMGVKLNDNI